MAKLLAVKPLSSLLKEAENEGESGLKRTLGPLNLITLGIGAIIGSGVFVLTGTAAAGEYFQAPSILHAQVLDIIVNFLRGGGTACKPPSKAVFQETNGRRKIRHRGPFCHRMDGGFTPVVLSAPATSEFHDVPRHLQDRSA